MREKGQVVLILILVMTVALGIGISVVQRSLSDVSTASKVEQSSRAFSAAEAGIEKAIQTGATVDEFTLDNNSSAVDMNTVPAGTNALEYPPIGKEEMAQVWLANPSDLAKVYDYSTLAVYWGNAEVTAGSDRPAIEITVIYDASGEYKSHKYFLESISGRSAGFDVVTCSSPAIPTSLSPDTDKTFLCGKDIDVSSTTLPGLSKLILLRARLLYSSTSQAFAVRPNSGSLPVQAKIFTATGTSGQTQRKIQVFRLDKVVPSFFDYAIFSAGTINK
ncbi:pilus assembly PilX N-terminal domain-containing protein [Candidatus Daviesbacteria bacterium]|nr:pilus assembly PilX N-terminal domain-containing protein [Candidatus Daviesbacteria bacterium]